MTAVTCPECGSPNILELISFENHVSWALCQACGHNFSFDYEAS